MGRLTDTVKVLLVVNIIFFIAKSLMGDYFDLLFSLFYFDHPYFKFWQPITHMFMHANFMHILFNMYGLYAFGSPLEMRWGRTKFLFFYFSAGLGAALIHTIYNYIQFNTGFDALLAAGFTEGDIATMLSRAIAPGSYLQLTEIPIQQSIEFFNSYNVYALGASGAVYGILVAFAIMFPNIELMLIFFPIPIKAKYFVPGLIAMDLIFGITGSPLGVAHWAHVGGALFGFIMAWYWKKNSFDNTRLY